MTRLTRRVAAGLNVVNNDTLVDSQTGVEYGGAGVTVLARQTDAVIVGNTSAVTTVFTYSDPGGQLGTSGIMRLTIMGTITDSALDTVTSMAIRFGYGGTTLATVTITTDDGATTIGTLQAFRLTFDLIATGTATTQSGAASGVIPLLAAPVRAPVAVLGTSTEDSDQPQDITVVFDWNNAAAAATATLIVAVLELL